MADFITVRFEESRSRGILEARTSNFFDEFKARRLLKEAIEDVADEIEKEAKIQAPLGPSGDLKLHPVDRSDTEIRDIPGFFDEGFGATASNIFLFAKGGGPGTPGFRGPGGRFIKPEAFRPAVDIPGQLIATSVLTVAQEPMHAIWVHNGTGIYGPSKSLITAKRPGGFMTFPASRWPTAMFKRSNYRFKSVKGQPAQPYLRNAFLLIDSTFVPMRMAVLRAQIAAET